MRYAVLAAAFCFATPVFGGVAEAVDMHVLPGYAAFADATTNLSQTANDTCTGDAVKAAYHEAFDAWMGISHIQFGPIETRQLTLSFSFWPDPKNQTGKSLGRLISTEDLVARDVEDYATVSVAAQGLMALERLLFETPAEGGYVCTLTQTIGARMAENAGLLKDDWATFAEEVRTPSASSTTIRSDDDARRALYTSLATGLQFLYEQRLGRPLGTFQKPRPTRAEARRSGRSLRNIELSLRAFEDFAKALADAPTPRTGRAFATAFSRLEGVDDPVLAGVADPGKRFKIEALQQDVRIIQQTVASEIGAELGVGTGFNSLDGD